MAEVSRIVIFLRSVGIKLAIFSWLQDPEGKFYFTKKDFHLQLLLIFPLKIIKLPQNTLLTC